LSSLGADTESRDGFELHAGDRVEEAGHVEAFEEGVDGDVFLLHPVAVLIIEVLGMERVLQMGDGLEQRTRLTLDRDFDQHVLVLQHRLQPDVTQPVDERADVLSADQPRPCGLTHQRQITQSGDVLDQLRRLSGVQVQLVTDPRIQRRGTIDLVVLARRQVRQQHRLHCIESILRGLDSVQRLAGVAGLERAHRGAHRVERRVEVHALRVLEQMFDDK
jgi:hypothetical protein